MIEPPTKTELSPPLISISLEYYLSLACRSFEGYAVIGLELSTLIKSIDPQEIYAHIEPISISSDSNPTQPQVSTNVARLYPIQTWRETSAKFYKDKERAEKDRKARYAQEENLTKTAHLIQRKRDILAEVNADVRKKWPRIADILTKNDPKMSWNQKEEFYIYFLFRSLNGENEGARVKFGIEDEVAKEFQSLPADPTFHNKYYLGGDLDLI